MKRIIQSTPNMRPNTFAFRLAEAMADQGLTQEQLASRLSVSQTTVSRWLAGSVPHKQKAILLARELDVNLEWLLEGNGEQRGYDDYPKIEVDLQKLNQASDAARSRMVRIALNQAAKGFPGRLRWLREHLGLSISDLAKKSGYSVSYISRLEASGARILPGNSLRL